MSLLLATRRQLSAPSARVLRFSHPQAVQLADAETRTLTGIHLAKMGRYQHLNYGTFEINRQTLNQLISNFDDGVYGQRIFVDVEHKPENGAAAEIERLYIDGDWLKGDITLTDYGHEAITKKRHIYLSIDYIDNYTHSETGQAHGPVLFGAGLTTRPFIKDSPVSRWLSRTQKHRETK